MLSQTKENMQAIVNKLEVLNFAMQSVATVHKDHTEQMELLFRQASLHKLKLVEELLRLSGSVELTPAA